MSFFMVSQFCILLKIYPISPGLIFLKPVITVYNTKNLSNPFVSRWKEREKGKWKDGTRKERRGEGGFRWLEKERKIEKKKFIKQLVKK